MLPIAPAYPNEDAFYCRFFTEVGSYLDAANRRLHEVDFRAEENEGAFSICPFRDSRHGLLMNKAALTQITGEWNEVIQGIKFYTSLFETENGKNLDLARAWRISLASMFAPLYLYRRGHESFANGTLPTPVSGVFKIMLDVPTTMDLMFIRGHDSDIAQSSDKTMPRQIQEFADKNLILLNGEYACAGSPGLIDNVVSILFENHKNDASDYGVYKRYFKEPQEFRNFVYYMSNQYIVGTMYLLATMTTMEKAFAQLQDVGLYQAAAHEAQGPLSAYERRRRIALDVMKEPANHESVLNQLASLVKDESHWKVDANGRFRISAPLAITVDFLKKTENADAELIADLHRNYQAEIETCLSISQKMAESSIGANGVFPSPVRFGDPQRNPANILRSMSLRPR